MNAHHSFGFEDAYTALQIHRAARLPLQAIVPILRIEQSTFVESAQACIQNEAGRADELADFFLNHRGITSPSSQITNHMKQIKIAWREAKKLVKPLADLAPDDMRDLNRRFAIAYVTAARHRHFQRLNEVSRRKGRRPSAPL